MLCQTCPLRSHCSVPCDAMLADLSNQESYQREFPLPQKKITEILEARQERGEIEVPEECEQTDDRLAALTSPEMVEQLRALLPELPDSQRLCIFLRFWKGLTVTEVAEAMDLSKSAVGTHLARALRRLRVGIEREFSDLHLSDCNEVGRCSSATTSGPETATYQVASC